jgi:two-component system NtrC family sensor kinase
VFKLKEYKVSLAGKLIIAVGALMCVVGVLFSIIIYQYEKRTLLRGLEEHARLASDRVMRGINQGMLTAERDLIQESLYTLSYAEDVTWIKIYDTEGKVVFASDPGMIGAVAGKDPSRQSVLKGMEDRTVMTTGPTGDVVLKYLSPIFNKPSCSTAECHFHTVEERVLGLLEMDMTAASVFRMSRNILISTVLFGALFMLIIASSLFFILYVIVTKPLSILEDGMKRLARGDFEHPIQISTKDEMGFVANTFNSMTQDVKRYRERLEDWAGELQKEVEKKTSEIREAHEHLIEAEKLASLGRLAAGVAHELNSPLTGILSFAHLMRQRMTPERKQDIEDVDVIIEQTHRCSKIIKGLLGFARKGVAEKMHININDLIESTVSMVANQAKFHNVKMNLEMKDGLPKVYVDPNQIQQVFINMLTNATDAMDNKGAITIVTQTTTMEDQQFVEVEFADTGYGIIPDHMGKIFEPFFTTKPVGMGTGLGLPVSYGIIKKHGGDILVRSAIGKGTSFRILLPAAAPGEAA